MVAESPSLHCKKWLDWRPTQHWASPCCSVGYETSKLCVLSSKRDSHGPWGGVGNSLHLPLTLWATPPHLQGPSDLNHWRTPPSS